MEKKIFIVFTMLVLAVYGCATPGRESFNLGQELAKQDRLDEAMAMYEDALKKEPDNSEYVSAMKKAKNALSEKHMQRAKAILSQMPITYEQAKTAYQEVDKANRLTPENPDVKKLVSLITSEMDRILKEAETFYSDASKAMVENKWVDGIKKLKEINKIYPGYLDVNLKLKDAESKGISYYLEETRKFKEDEEWESVIETLLLALEITPDNAEMLSALKEARIKHSPDYYIAKAEEFFAKNEWGKATELAQHAYELNPSDNIREIITRIQQQTGIFYLNQFKEHLSENRLYSAYRSVITAFKYHPLIKNEKETADAIDKLVGNIITKAEAYKSNGYLGNALSWYEKIIEIEPKHKNALLNTQSLKDSIKERVVKKIAIMDFTSPSDKPDVGRVVTDNLLSYITSNASSEVKVLARDVLGAILKEIEYGQAGIYDIESAKKAGKLKGTDIFIFGSVLDYDVDRNVSEGYQIRNVVVGKKSTPNPAYQLWLMSRRGAAPTEEDLKNAPPPVIEEEVRETVKYKVGTEKKMATAAVSFRVIAVEEGEVVITETIKEQKDVKDDYSEGVAFANVPFDPLEIPMDNELLGEVIQKVVEKLGYKVLSRFQNLQIQYYNSAEMLKKRMEHAKALEKYIDSIYIEEIKNISSPLSENARKEVERLLQQIEIE